MEELEDFVQNPGYYAVFMKKFKGSSSSLQKNEETTFKGCFETEREALLNCIHKYQCFIDEPTDYSRIFEMDTLQLRHLVLENQKTAENAQTIAFFSKTIHNISFQHLNSDTQIPETIPQKSTEILTAEETKKRKRVQNDCNLPSDNNENDEFFAKRRRIQVSDSKNSDPNNLQVVTTTAMIGTYYRNRQKETLQQTQTRRSHDLTFYDQIYQDMKEKNEEIKNEIFEIELNYCESRKAVAGRDYDHARKILEKLKQFDHPPSLYYLGCLYSWYLLGDREWTKGETMCQQSAAKALEYFEKRVESNKNCQMLAGRLYCMENPATRNNEKAYLYTKLAADHGSARAMLNLGFIHLKGELIEKDLKKYVELLNFSAQRDYAVALYAIGDYFYRGIENFIEKDLEKAFSFFKRASKLNYTVSFEILGEMLSNGMGCRRNLSKAMKYFKRGAERGSSFCCCRLGLLYDSGDEQIKENEEKAVHHLKTGTKGSSQIFCLNNLGMFYLHPNGTIERNFDLSSYFFSRSGAEGEIEKMKENGQFPEENYLFKEFP